MKLIDNFVEKFHNNSLPSPEKCFVLEDGDELYINKWIKNGKINGKMKDIFEWIEKKYLSNNKLNLLSQKKILKKMLVSYHDEYLHNENKKIISKLKIKKNFFKKIFSMNIAQSLILNGDRGYSYGRYIWYK